MRTQKRKAIQALRQLDDRTVSESRLVIDERDILLCDLIRELEAMPEGR